MLTLRPVLDLPPSIAAGILSGKYFRMGGAVRVAAGYQGAGQIVALLRDSGPASAVLYSVAPTLAAAPILAAGASVATLGVCAIGFSMLHEKVNRICQEIAETRQAIGGLAADFDRPIVAKLETAVELLCKIERARVPASSEYLTPAVERFLEAAHIYRSRLDETPDDDREVLDKYFKALAVAIAGELACHYLREDWTELLAASSKAREWITPRKERLVSLALVGSPTFSSWQSNSVAAACLALPSNEMPFQAVVDLARTLDPDITTIRLIDALRPVSSSCLDDPKPWDKLRLAESTQCKKSKGYFFGSLNKDNLLTLFKASFSKGVNAMIVGTAVESYSDQYEFLRRADLPARKLRELLIGIPHDKDAYLIRAV